MVGLGKFNDPFQCKCYDYSRERRTFQPYWRCSHGCLGCYARKGYRWTYWGKVKKSIVSVDLEKAIKDYRNLKSKSEIEIAPSCDAFDLVYEKKHRITKRFLELINQNIRKDIYFTFLTKSALIAEYKDLIPKESSVIQITVESYRDKMKITSPSASSYKERLNCVKDLVMNNHKVGIRIDPIIPQFDKIDEIKSIIQDFDCLGIRHITISFMKLYENQIQRVSEKLGLNLRERMERANKKEFFIKEEIRKKMAKKIRSMCDDLGLTFAMCRENVVRDTGLCDPFHLIDNYTPKKVENNYKKITDFKK
jgi:DNA repair photolyase